MKLKFIVLIASVILIGCSTVDRRLYYSPNVDVQYKSGPEKPPCGWKSFGGLPDSYTLSKSDNKIIVSANQKLHPYFWGPWFVSVIPVFPITWIGELFVNNEIKVQATFEGSAFNKELSFSIKSKEGDSEILPVEVKPYFGDGYGAYEVTFPIEYSSIHDFFLKIKSSIDGFENIEIQFNRTSRWAWTQWTPNC